MRRRLCFGVSVAALAASALVTGLTVDRTPPQRAGSLQSLLDQAGSDLPFDPQLAAFACPTERGPVKEGADADRNRVSTKVISSTVNYLRTRPKPSRYPRNSRIAPYELRTYQLSAYLTQYKVESDGDIHLVLKDSAGNGMIAEIPYGSCVPGASRWRQSIAGARTRFTQTMHPTSSWQKVHRKITLRGLPMFDVLHGQTGAAKNGIELHPVIGVSFTATPPGGTATGTTTPTSTSTSSPTQNRAVHLASIYYNPPGADDGSTTSLDEEWVAITNGAATAADLSGWTLSDAQSHVYTFPTFSLPGGGTVEVHTGSGSNTATDVYWGSGQYIWNNTGDTATLAHAGGVVDTCSYTSSGSSTAGQQAAC